MNYDKAVTNYNETAMGYYKLVTSYNVLFADYCLSIIIYYEYETGYNKKGTDDNAYAGFEDKTGMNYYFI